MRSTKLEVDATHQAVEGLYRRHGFTLRRRSRWIFEPGPGPSQGSH